jgi:hypothetical protein
MKKRDDSGLDENAAVCCRKRNLSTLQKGENNNKTPPAKAEHRRFNRPDHVISTKMIGEATVMMKVDTSIMTLEKPIRLRSDTKRKGCFGIQV